MRGATVVYTDEREMMTALVVSGYARNDRMTGVFVAAAKAEWEERWYPDKVKGDLWERVAE